MRGLEFSVSMRCVPASRKYLHPADEAEYVEDSEEQEDDASRPVTTRKHVDGRCEAKKDVEYASNPDKLLRELARTPHVRITEDGGHSQNKCEENDRVRVERKLVRIAVDASTIILRFTVTLAS